MGEHRQQDVVRHIRERFAKASIIEAPFPNLVIRDVLPNYLYQRDEGGSTEFRRMVYSSDRRNLKIYEGILGREPHNIQRKTARSD